MKKVAINKNKYIFYYNLFNKLAFISQMSKANEHSLKFPKLNYKPVQVKTLLLERLNNIEHKPSPVG